MLREGHIGIGLLAFAPFGAILAVFDAWIAIVLLFWAVAVSSVFPDFDTSTRLVKHRGWTHTVWFVLTTAVLGAVLGVVAVSWGLEQLSPLPWVISDGADPALLAGTISCGFLIGTTSHILGDMLTPRGIRPFEPVTPRGIAGVSVSDTKISLDIVKASNRIANLSFLIVGGASALAVLLVAF